jgi:hypothetical protein
VSPLTVLTLCEARASSALPQAPVKEAPERSAGTGCLRDA